MHTAAANTTAKPNMLPETALALDFLSVGEATASFVAVIDAEVLAGVVEDVELSDSFANSKRICGRNVVVDDASALVAEEVSSTMEVVEGLFFDLDFGAWDVDVVVGAAEVVVSED